MGNSAHSNLWSGTTSRGQRLTRKLGKGITLEHLERLLQGCDKEPDPWQDEGGEG